MRQPIYYTMFSENKIFSDVALNIFLNQLYTYLLNSFDSKEVLDKFLIDGSVALAMQGELNSKALGNFRISVSSKKIFDFIKSSISGLSIDEFVASGSQVKIKVSSKILHIEYSATDMSKVDIKGISVRNKSEIKI